MNLENRRILNRPWQSVVQIPHRFQALSFPISISHWTLVNLGTERRQFWEINVLKGLHLLSSILNAFTIFAKGKPMLLLMEKEDKALPSIRFDKNATQIIRTQEWIAGGGSIHRGGDERAWMRLHRRCRIHRRWQLPAGGDLHRFGMPVAKDKFTIGESLWAITLWPVLLVIFIHSFLQGIFESLRED